MKLLPLVLANLFRHKLRTLLTTLGVALATFLFASLRSVVTTLNAGAEVASASRMGVQNATAIVFPLPMSYRERLAAVPGISARDAATLHRFFAALQPASEAEAEPEPPESAPE